MRLPPGSSGDCRVLSPAAVADSPDHPDWSVPPLTAFLGAITMPDVLASGAFPGTARYLDSMPYEAAGRNGRTVASNLLGIEGTHTRSSSDFGVCSGRGRNINVLDFLYQTSGAFLLRLNHP